MRIKAQSLIEFAVILMIVTAIAIVSLQIISNKINSSTHIDPDDEDTVEDVTDPAGRNCMQNGLTWDKKNGVCY